MAENLLKAGYGLVVFDGATVFTVCLKTETYYFLRRLML
jgi:hypothetical protein